MMLKLTESVSEVRVQNIARIFQTFAPYPFRERDLDREAEEFIVGWARDEPQRDQFVIRVRYRSSDVQAAAAPDLQQAIARHFSAGAEATQRDINELFRIGRWSLAIGLAILAYCLTIAHFGVPNATSGPLSGLLQESLLILGWVANWRPLEIFLYDWWPMARGRDLFQRVAKAQVETVYEVE